MTSSSGTPEVQRKNGNGLLLYSHYRSFYCQKVIMALHEKKLDFQIHKMNVERQEQFEEWYLKLNSRGEVPVLQDGMKVIPDSHRIIEYIEDNFSNGDTPRIIPLGHEVKRKVLHYRNILEAIPIEVIASGSLFHNDYVRNPKPPYVGLLRTLGKGDVQDNIDHLEEAAEKHFEFQESLLQRIKEEKNNYKQMTDVNGYAKLVLQLEDVLDQVEIELALHASSSDMWLCSEVFSVADIHLSLMLHWLNAIGFQDHLWGDGKRPNIAKYYEGVQTRDSFLKTVTFSHSCIMDSILRNIPLLIGITAGALVIFGMWYYFKKVK